MDDLAPGIVDAARQGDPAAIEALLRWVHPRAWAIARRLLVDESDAADATQEALLAIARGLPRFDGRSAIGTWCHRVATNACLDELRRRRRRPLPTDLDDQPPRSAAGPGVDDLVGDRLDLDAALARLGEDHRTILVLREVAGHDYAEIAELLGVPVGTVRSRLARARRQLLESVEHGNSPTAPDVQPRT